MDLHTEVPLVALLGLMHLGIALPILVLGRTGGGDQRGIDGGALPEHQAFAGERGLNSSQICSAIWCSSSR